METDTIYGRKDPAAILLSDYLELLALEPDKNEWDNDSFNGSPPRKYRLLRMKSCLKALGFEMNANDSIELPLYLRELDTSEMTKIEDILEVNFSLYFTNYVTERSPEVFNQLFIDCLQLLKGIYKLQNTFSEKLAASNHLLTPLLIRDQILEKISKERETLEKAMVLMLNKEAHTYTYEELVELYDFPNVDLGAIDLDWI